MSNISHSVKNSSRLSPSAGLTRIWLYLSKSIAIFNAIIIINTAVFFFFEKITLVSDARYLDDRYRRDIPRAECDIKIGKKCCTLETIDKTRKARSEAPKYRDRKRRKGRAFEASLVPLGIARFCYGEFCHGGRDPTCKHPCGQELRFGIRRR